LAVERALRERRDLPRVSAAVGELVFAQSVNGRVLRGGDRASDAGGMQVRYLSGGEDTVTLAQLRPCSFRPESEW
jgi:hypothetical protein